MISNLKYLVFVLFPLFLNSCETDDNTKPSEYPKVPHGIIITNEGSFQQNNGSVTYMTPEADILVKDIFYAVNHNRLGDVVQSFAVADSLGFIVVNNSQKVEVVDLNNFKSVGAFQASYPRYFCYAGDGKGFLTNGSFPGQVLVVDTKNLRIEDTIVVGNNPEHLVFSNNKLFVANGAWGNDSTVSVIDGTTNELINNIFVGDGPTDLVAGNNNAIWILCQGKVTYGTYPEVLRETESRLVCLNSTTLEITDEIVIGATGDGYNPYMLAVSAGRDSLYFIEKLGVYSFDIIHHQVSLEPVFQGSFYGLGINPVNGNIFALEANGFSSNGTLHIVNTAGLEITHFETGIGPNGVVFY